MKREESYDGRDSDLEFRSEREESVERGHSSHSHKRKEREHIEDKDDREEKRTRVSEERKESRRFEDRVEDGKELNGGEREGRRERRKFGDKAKKEDDMVDIEDGKRVKEEVTDKKFDDAQATGSANGNASVGNVSFLLL